MTTLGLVAVGKEVKSHEMKGYRANSRWRGSADVEGCAGHGLPADKPGMHPGNETVDVPTLDGQASVRIDPCWIQFFAIAAAHATIPMSGFRSKFESSCHDRQRQLFEQLRRAAERRPKVKIKSVAKRARTRLQCANGAHAFRSAKHI
jgi:hypothetical protein